MRTTTNQNDAAADELAPSSLVPSSLAPSSLAPSSLVPSSQQPPPSSDNNNNNNNNFQNIDLIFDDDDEPAASSSSEEEEENSSENYSSDSSESQPSASPRRGMGRGTLGSDLHSSPFGAAAAGAVPPASHAPTSLLHHQPSRPLKRKASPLDATNITTTTTTIPQQIQPSLPPH